MIPSEKTPSRISPRGRSGERHGRKSERAVSMRNIVLARVDDRLIHGEVVMSWIPATRANRIIIVDDALAADPFGSRVVKLLVPQDKKCFIYTVEQAAEKLMKEGAPKEKILVLAKTPATFYRLVQAGVPIREVNLGGTGIDETRKPFFKNISLSREEVDAVDGLMSGGCRVYYQLVPDQKAYSLENAVEEAKKRFASEG